MTPLGKVGPRSLSRTRYNDDTSYTNYTKSRLICHLKVSVVEPKEEQPILEPYSEPKTSKPFDTVQQAI